MMASDLGLQTLSELTGGRRLKKRGITAKLADRDRRHGDNLSKVGSVSSVNEIGGDGNHEVQQLYEFDDEKRPNKWRTGRIGEDESEFSIRETRHLDISDAVTMQSALSDTSFNHYTVSGNNTALKQSASDTNLNVGGQGVQYRNSDSPEAAIQRFRSFKMSQDPICAAQFKHLPSPPVRPRQSTNGETRNRDKYLSSEERDNKRSIWRPKRSSIVNTGVEEEGENFIYAEIHENPGHRTKDGDISEIASVVDTTQHRDTNVLSVNNNFVSGDLFRINVDKILTSQTEPEINSTLDGDVFIEDNPSYVRHNHLPPLSPSHKLHPLSLDASSRAQRTAYKSDNSSTRDILLERSDSIGEYKSADSLSVGSNCGLPVIFTQQVKNKGVDLNASCQSNNSLFGADELDRYLPDKKLNIFVGSWNMCEIKTSPVSLDDFILPSSSKILLDMYVIGTQENAMNKKEWEIQIQETLGLSHVLLYSATHGALHIVTFIRRDLMWFCSGLDWDCVSTRAVTVVKTKGAVAMSVSIFGTSMLFVNSHLTCDSNKTKHRMADYEKIIRQLKLPRSLSLQGSILTRFDCIFWCGDLNFRIDKGRSHVDVMLGHLNTLDHPNFEDLIYGDQLNKCITEGRIFEDFQEGRISFSPTYKFDIDSDEYDTSSKMRIPSYTDRVLFLSKIKNNITCVCYDSVMDIKVSDHRPVYAQFQASIKPVSNGNHPDFELKFDKSVYIEASRRRGLQKQLTRKVDKSSAVCSVM